MNRTGWQGLETLDSPVRTYAWGSREVLAALRGRPVPSPEPEAELWMGAHPAASSVVRRAGGTVSMAGLIETDPEAVLGPAVYRRFGARLPYLLKLLAAAEPLSLQAHPDERQAREGYEAERAAGAAEFNYVDRHHKPELLVAVSDFEALCGFREPSRTADLLAGLAVPDLAPVVALLRGGDLREAVGTLLRWPARGRAALVDGVVTAAACAARTPEYALVERLAKYYPDDVGVVVALLLNYVTLAPGQAIWMPAGNLHAYLRGTGVEIMAASDNVLRGGMTPKRVDVDELLRVLRFTPLADPVVRAEPVAPGVIGWPTPVAEFRLYQVTLDAGVPAVELALDGPRTVFCLSGEVTADDGAPTSGVSAGGGPWAGGGSGVGEAAGRAGAGGGRPAGEDALDGGAAVTLGPGEAAFGAASGRPLRLSGSGTAFVATTNKID